ncbi:MAG TPA: RNA methyltransferase [Alphaproteobacteria bacterium]|nr:RNA methyltransferase [Alphaproteobacteria bacterium]
MHLTSAANPRLKSIAALAQKKYRAESGLFMAEGWEFIGFALRAGWRIQTLVYGVGRHHVLLDKATTMAEEVYTVPPELLGKVTGKDNPQAVVATFKQKWEPLIPATAREGFWIALDRPRDPGNVGTIIRTADASGAGGVMLVGDAADAYGPESVRATMGSVFNIPLVKCTEEGFLNWRERYKGLVIGTQLKGSIDYRNLPVERPAVLLMGNEQQGLNPALADVCTHLARIPMPGKAESLNLAAATAVLAFQLNRV